MYTLENLIRSTTGKSGVSTEINGRWVSARPYVLWSVQRLRDAWAVLTMRADAFTWPEGQ